VGTRAWLLTWWDKHFEKLLYMHPSKIFAVWTYERFGKPKNNAIEKRHDKFHPNYLQFTNHEPSSYFFMLWTESSAITATDCRLDNRGLIAGKGGKKLSLLHVAQTGSGAHLTSYPNGCRGFFPGGVRGRGTKLATNLHPVPRSWMVELYLHSWRELSLIMLQAGRSLVQFPMRS
jgi:hypothetical protein